MKRPAEVFPVRFEDGFIAQMILPIALTDDDKVRLCRHLMIMTTDEEFEAEEILREMGI